ncbi:LysE/ArgO family amino acid transporter [Acinetobacter sp. MD2(2019)]|uniref:LysE/ArgO family amino acid transporter n=1 Tax=Acinetobacter sp. MD2(2019) TaxID=2605273 RepID=UPI002D1E9D8E|nr:LysE/ArgO family amino acid transporter [Acinetobacter sp. MD2(2019)]MEB3753791.1 amino acid transporter [Acinetobacter sp. MD2(2019)]
MYAFVYGLSTGFSLIVAIGAQNVFVLKQGLKQQSIFLVCFICALSDSLLILAGVLGMSKLVVDFPQIVSIAKYVGAAFLTCYGLIHLWSALKNKDEMTTDTHPQQSLYRIVMTCLALTWLNPHVYLDTLFLVGSISVKFQDVALQFAIGVILASWIFFFTLGYGARILLPLLKKAQTWRYLNFIIAVIMWMIAYRLLES